MKYQPSDMDTDELTAVFTAIGAPDPAAWARSEADDDIPQLGRYLFLRGCWATAVPHDDHAWIDRVIEADRRGEAGEGGVLQRMLAAGVTREDITRLVRGMQREMIAGIASLLDDPHPALETLPKAARSLVADYGWALVELDDGRRARAIAGLHESVLETDPAGDP